MNYIDALDLRLNTIASMVRSGVRLADIGCDHGYLVCALMRDGMITSGLACDINEKPLNKARSEIARHGLDGKIECRLGDGLESVGSDEVDDIVIAGMGGEMIAAILERCNWSNMTEKRFVLQPMTKAPILRRWLCNNGFSIIGEHACVCAKHVYTVMSVKYTGRKCKMGEYDLYCYSGELTCDPSPEAKLFLIRALSSLKKRKRGIEAVDPDTAGKLLRLINKLTTVIEEGR